MDLAEATGNLRLKTLHLTNSWHASSGGIGTFYRALFETANRAGHRMSLVAPGAKTSVEEVGEFGRIYYIEAPFAPLNHDYRIVLPHRYILPGTALRRILTAEQPDLVEIADKYATHYLAGLLRTRRLPGVRLRPTVVGMSHERMDENVAAYLSPTQGARILCRFYMKWLYFPMFDHHITVSEHTAGELIEAARGHKIQRSIWVAPMGVDCELFHPGRRNESVRARLAALTGASPDATLVLYAGRLAPEKDVGLLIDAASLLDPALFRVVIAGGGMLLESLRRECERRGLAHVVFLGHVADREKLADHYANTDVFLHPNAREPFGIAPLEAMASGLPLVAPAAGGVASYADAANSWPVDARRENLARALAETVRAVRAWPEESARRARAARSTAEEHRWPKVTEHYLRLYRYLHALTLGQRMDEVMTPRAYSTPGDMLGRELAQHIFPKMF